MARPNKEPQYPALSTGNRNPLTQKSKTWTQKERNTMHKRLRLFAVVLFAMSLTAFAQTMRAKYICKVSHLSVTSVGISCLNGADPTGQKLGDVLVISCGN